MTYANWKIQAPEELITPEEICDIIDRAGTMDDAERGNT